MVKETKHLLQLLDLILGFQLRPDLMTGELACSYASGLISHSAAAACRGDLGPVPTQRCLRARLADISAQVDWLGPWLNVPAKDHCFGGMEDQAQPDHLPAAPKPKYSLQDRGMASDRA